MPEDESTQQRRKKWRETHGRPFDLEKQGERLLAVLEEILAAPQLTQEELARILRRHTAEGIVFSKDQLLTGYRQLCAQRGQAPDLAVLRRLQIKPRRTLSGVAPVAVMTMPYPCPGSCLFCPSPDGMPRSYLPGEPSSLRAVEQDFDPWGQAAGRLKALRAAGHSVDKIELIIQGGSWSAYPPEYQEWFVRRCLDAMNGSESASLEEAQQRNESAQHRNVGLVVETRPDLVTPEEVRRLRRLGVTKVQLGVQSLDDEVLALNRRGHDVAATRQAMRLLRLAAFKIVVHWMPNLLGATPESDRADFRRLWDDPALRPDELKIYPTALLAETGLYQAWERGEYRPYDEQELVQLLADCKTFIPPYCRVNRLMRDIDSSRIVAGVRMPNLRQVVQRHMAREGQRCHCIRCREVQGQEVDEGALWLERVEYETGATRELFLQGVTPQGRLAGFLRLSLPQVEPPLEELHGCALVRELHVYGPALDLDSNCPGAAQHAGLGTRLLEEAARLAGEAGYGRLAVIAAIGTRMYYRERGFGVGELYMVREVGKGDKMTRMIVQGEG